MSKLPSRLFKINLLKMLGNDVVDLRLAKIQSNWKRRNYLSKIYSAGEQIYIDAADDPDLIVWLLWSMKEAAYKIVNRNTSIRCYEPKGFCCSFELNGSSAKGEVSYRGEKFLTHSEFSPERIHTLSFGTGVCPAQCRVIQLSDTSYYKSIS
ncbi:MAG: 4-phosphopantetheinyl transferase family protein, partial [Chitinophagaceae bacterium]